MEQDKSMKKIFPDKSEGMITVLYNLLKNQKPTMKLIKLEAENQLHPYLIHFSTSSVPFAFCIRSKVQ